MWALAGRAGKALQLGGDGPDVGGAQSGAVHGEQGRPRAVLGSETNTNGSSMGIRACAVHRKYIHRCIHTYLHTQAKVKRSRKPDDGCTAAPCRAQTAGCACSRVMTSGYRCTV